MGINIIRPRIVDVSATDEFCHFIDNGRVISVAKASSIKAVYKRASQKIRRLK